MYGLLSRWMICFSLASAIFLGLNQYWRYPVTFGACHSGLQAQVKAKKSQLPSGFSYDQRRNTFLPTNSMISSQRHFWRWSSFPQDGICEFPGSAVPTPRQEMPPAGSQERIPWAAASSMGPSYKFSTRYFWAVLFFGGVGLTPAPVQTHEPNRLAWLHLNVNPDWLLNSPAHVCSI